ncbi:MAG: DUF1648 domain-containing protein [Erythrobacter sp.]|jgi:hypothetical protein|nr:DUF1648 domain-containing protein [Erythrobacter sp.]RZV34962.1 MAG: hypothetical protein EX262_03375 [Sphingomonadaceae bacterium]
MANDGELGLALLAVVALVYSAVWTDRRYRRFEQLPAHYDIRGNATRFASRRLMAWLLPGVCIAMLVAIALVTWLVPPGLQNGDQITGLVVASVAMLGSQGLVLWLHERWARKQDAG